MRVEKGRGGRGKEGNEKRLLLKGETSDGRWLEDRSWPARCEIAGTRNVLPAILCLIVVAMGRARGRVE